MANFALTLVHGSAWDGSIGAREQTGWNEHAAFMDGLVEAGFILFGGPIGDQLKTLHLVEATDESEVRQRLAQDPWAQASLLEVGSILPWALWLDFRSPESGPG
ncbi:MAG TPA: YciI family protein [Candidatus Dormibacteraeota bacterium]